MVKGRVPQSVPALVTGASSGIGEEFARQLASRGHDLVLVARRQDRLQRLAGELQSRHSVEAEVLVADLSTDAGVATVEQRLSPQAGWILVNNAGFGSRGNFAALDDRREEMEVRLNVLALHRLTRAVLPGCIEARAGGVINVASTAAFQPLPHMATYAATKAFVLHFTEAVAEELRGSGARVLALCPGMTATEFSTAAGSELSHPLLPVMTAAQVVEAGLRAFDRGQGVCIPGGINVALATAPRLLPRVLVRRIVAKVLPIPH